MHLAGLGLHDLGAAVLRAPRERLQLLVAQLLVGRGLAEKRQDSHARVPAHHRHVHLPHVLAHHLRIERLCAHLHASCKPPRVYCLGLKL